MDAMHSDDGPETFRLIARLYMGFGIAAVTLLTLISPWLVQWFTAPAFHTAWPIVGILAWQALFYGFFLIASAGIWKAEKTYFNLPLMTVSAMAGLMLHWLLVPSWSGMGAALATVITYFGWTVASMVVSERLWRIGLPIKLFAIQLVIGAGLVSWFVLTDFSHGLLLKCIAGLFASLVIALSSLPVNFTSLLKKRSFRRKYKGVR
jgi:O-antigen/teichoic acid export membrane protein